MDARINELLAKKDVHCTLRKQPRHLTVWFQARLVTYNYLRDHYGDDIQIINSLLDRIFTLLKFVGKPNDLWRKDAIIKEYWGQLQADIEPYLPH